MIIGNVTFAPAVRKGEVGWALQDSQQDSGTLAARAISNMAKRGQPKPPKSKQPKRTDLLQSKFRVIAQHAIEEAKKIKCSVDEFALGAATMIEVIENEEDLLPRRGYNG